MKTIIAALFTFLLTSSVWAQNISDAGSETTLNVAAGYLDTVFMDTLTSLELIASTPEAKKGDWNGIKRYLARLAESLPGVYFFVLPDGNYYTVAQDYTNLNLSDRPYFKSLFAGNPVKGFPIYSRSSGKKSALEAVPIMVEGKIIGALGASVFLDELHTRLNRDFALPQRYTWFVLDARGNTMLDQESDFIFMNTLTQGSPSLREAVSEALKKESGTMQYELGGAKQAYYRKLPNMPWWMVLARSEGDQIQTPPPLNFSLERFVPDLQKRLNQIDASLKKLIANSNVNVKNGNEIRNLLDSILDENPDVIETSFVDLKGFLRQIEPSDYKNFENTDISTQEHVIALRKNGVPVFSGGFTAVEGFLAVDIAYPVYDNRKNLAGSISSLIRPELLVQPLLKKNTIPDDYELWIMQPDGKLIYDQDRDEIGRNLFSDPMYAEYESLLALGKKIASAPSGEGSYLFLAPGSKAKVIKKVVWQSIRLHGTEWRVALAYRPYEQIKR